MNTVKVISWQASPTSKAGLGFYPATKFIGQVFSPEGVWLAETGKCSTRLVANQRAHALNDAIMIAKG